MDKAMAANPVKRMLALVLIVALGAFAAGQESRKVAVLFSSASLDEAAWRASVEGAIASSTRIGLVLRVPEGEDPIAFSYSRGCDLAVTVEAEASSIGVQVSWRIDAPAFSPGGDGLRPSPVDSFEYEAPLPDQRRLATSFWLDLQAKVEAALGRLPPAGTATLLLHAAPGTVFEGLGKARQTMPESGELSLRLRAPATYLWTASAPGMETKRGVLSMAGPSSLEVSLGKAKRMSFEVGLNHGAFADYRFTWLGKGDASYLRLALSPYFLGLSLHSADSFDPAPILVSYKLLEAGFGVGLVLGRGGDRLHFSLGLDAFFRVRNMGNDGPLDAVAPMRLAPYAGAEWPLGPNSRLFFELGLDLFPQCLGYLMNSTNSGDFSWGSYTGTDFYLEFPSFRFGARWPL
jgi:hypothetical protein